MALTTIHLVFRIATVTIFFAMAFILIILKPKQDKEIDEDDVIYGCRPDYKSYNRNKDFLDEQ